MSRQPSFAGWIPVRSVLVVLLLLLCSCVTLLGQAATGTIEGQILDEQGAAIPAADIKLVETATGSSRTAQSNEVGRFTIVSIPPGVYDITVTKMGFQTSKAVGQKVDVGAVLTLNLSLKVGAAATTVEVSATAAAELQTMNSTIGSTITNESLNLLPNLGRDASSLSVLQVGVSLDGNVGGAAIDQNKFQLDGGNNSDDMAGGNTTYTPGNGYSGTGATGGTPTGVIPTPIESIEEFKIGTSGQGADFNGAAGSQVQMVTKRGTNQFHGALYEYYFGSNVGAANLWTNNHTLQANGQAQPLPSTHRNRYGFAVGGPATPKFWGGKTYFFYNFEGSKFPNVVTFERGVPTALMRAGVLQLTNTSGQLQAFNMNPYAVTVNGTTYAPASCGSTLCDPRGIGLNPIVQKLFSTLPLPNDTSYSAGSSSAGLVDGVNAQGYRAPLALPQHSNFMVGRIDHDFGEKWKLMMSYRYYNFVQLASTQVDIGGLLPGATAGAYTAFAPRPVKPSYLVAGLTTTLSTSLTNDFRFSYLRNFWQWSTQAGRPQYSNLGGAVEIGGESQVGALIPYNVDSQDVRQRFWDGHDYFVSDSMSKLWKNHLFQFGGTFQKNIDLHGRDDNGVGINTSLVYKLDGTGISSAAYTLPNGAASNQLSNYQIMYNELMGIVTQTQVMYSRSGANLQLNPLGTPGSDHSKIPMWDVNFNDTWHMRPSLTLSYGLSWTAALPPYEYDGKQVVMVDSAGSPIEIKGYLLNRQAAALKGQVYNPTIGFATIGNVNGGTMKYPFNPFYGGFSPHASLAWNPRFQNSILKTVFGDGKTVVRGGYGRIYGRLNGVDLLLVPLLGPGLLQAVSCVGVTSSGQCAGAGNANPATAFRIGTDGLTAPIPTTTPTLPQPFYPGTVQNGVLSAASADGSQLNPVLRPNHSDEFNFTLQRAINNKMILEVGYMGRKIANEFQEINIDPIPWMTTLNGQSFAQAYANVYNQMCGGTPGNTCKPAVANVTPQPFFEAALGGPGSVYCTGSPNCTAALASKQSSNFATTQAYALWLAMTQANGWTLGRTMQAQSGAGQSMTGAFDFINSYGRGNYNAAFFSFTAKDFHGLTARNNFTWGRALGTGSVVQASSSITVPNPYDFNNFGTYGTQPFDVKFTYSLLMLYQPPFYKAQHGVIGKVLGGWNIAPLFVARTGLPQRLSVNGNAQAFGEIYSGQSSNYENAAGLSAYTGGAGSANYNVAIPSGGVASAGKTGVNMFADPLAVYNEFRHPVLGQDFNSGGAGPLRGFPFWNLDATLSKDFKATEHIGATLTFQFVNVLNHFTPANPTTNIDTPSSFGVVTGQFATANGAQARSMEFGLRVRF